jgi:hypothetical protein
MPGDSQASGFPVVCARFVLYNPTEQNVRVSLAGCLENFIGRDASGGAARANLNEWRQGAGLRGIFCHSQTLPQDAPQWGSLAIAVLEAPRQRVSGRTRWNRASWGQQFARLLG